MAWMSSALRFSAYWNHRALSSVPKCSSDHSRACENHAARNVRRRGAPRPPRSSHLRGVQLRILRGGVVVAVAQVVVFLLVLILALALLIAILTLLLLLAALVLLFLLLVLRHRDATLDSDFFADRRCCDDKCVLKLYM